MRLTPRNFHAVESVVGTDKAIGLLEQIFRLIDQAVPPYFPNYILPTGEVLLIVDNMMASFVENKIRAICEHLTVWTRTSSAARIEIDFVRKTFKDKKNKALSLEDLIKDTAPSSISNTAETGVILKYGNHRA